MKNNKIISSLIIIWILFNLASCSSEEVKNDIVKNEDTNKIIPVYNYKTQITNTNVIKTNSIEKKLTIDERCIGCGKCARIAPNNFVMNFNTFKAEVISQKNIDSREVQYSQQICPTDSIHTS